MAQSAEAVEYTTASLQRGKTPPISVLVAQSAGVVEYTDSISAEG